MKRAARPARDEWPSPRFRGAVQNPAYRLGDMIWPARGCPLRAGLQFYASSSFETPRNAHAFNRAEQASKGVFAMLGWALTFLVIRSDCGRSRLRRNCRRRG